MKKILFICSYFIVTSFCHLKAQPQWLDSSFNNSGFARVSKQNAYPFGYDVLVHPNQKIILAGYMSDPANVTAPALIQQFNADGTPDQSFGNNGYVEFSDSVSLLVSNVLLQPNNKIIVTGRGVSQGLDDYCFALRFLPDGTPDSTFGNNGTFYLQLSNEDTYFPGAALQPDGKLLICGYVWGTPSSQSLILRLDQFGAVDSTFDSDGVKVIQQPPGSGMTVSTVDIQNSKIVVGGTRSSSSSTTSAFLVRLNPDGSIDPSFGVQGYTQSFSTSVTSTHAMQVRSDGSICLGGNIKKAGDDIAMVAMFLQDGKIDSNFADNGVREIDGTLHPLAAYANTAVMDMDILQDGSIIVAGENRSGVNVDILVARLLSDGTPDSAYGHNGVIITSLGPGVMEDGNAVAVQADGKAVVAGTYIDGSVSEMLVVRYKQPIGLGIASVARTEYKVDVYPIPPLNGALTIRVGSNAPMDNFQLYDNSGRLVVLVPADEIHIGGSHYTMQIPPTLQPGIYYLHVAGRDFSKVFRLPVR